LSAAPRFASPVQLDEHAVHLAVGLFQWAINLKCTGCCFNDDLQSDDLQRCTTFNTRSNDAKPLVKKTLRSQSIETNLSIYLNSYNNKNLSLKGCGDDDAEIC